MLHAHINIYSFKHKGIKINGMRFTAISIAYHIIVVKNIKEFYTSKNNHFTILCE